eukprot:TRINITY_DN1225_c0_g1_i2.p1 TRINITY_DN1225_c0_g1~~TRINITY_DN1225_c0_g1_i2.p1  ORF type:complete len:1036 (-),score=184.99 TRINITY_DN1225_c0_g1_i2:260-3175(-)
MGDAEEQTQGELVMPEEQAGGNETQPGDDDGDTMNLQIEQAEDQNEQEGVQKDEEGADEDAEQQQDQNVEDVKQQLEETSLQKDSKSLQESSIEVFIGGLAGQVKDEAVHKAVKQVIEDYIYLRVARRKKIGECRGYATVKVPSLESAQKLCEELKEVDGRIVGVHIARGKALDESGFPYYPAEMYTELTEPEEGSTIKQILDTVRGSIDKQGEVMSTIRDIFYPRSSQDDSEDIEVLTENGGSPPTKKRKKEDGEGESIDEVIARECRGCNRLINKFRATATGGSKTALAILNEYAARLNMEVSYEEEGDETGMFKCCAKLNRRGSGNSLYAQGIGTGRSKKDAKQLSAAFIIESLLKRVPESDFMASIKRKGGPQKGSLAARAQQIRAMPNPNAALGGRGSMLLGRANVAGQRLTPNQGRLRGVGDGSLMMNAYGGGGGSRSVGGAQGGGNRKGMQPQLISSVNATPISATRIQSMQQIGGLGGQPTIVIPASQLSGLTGGLQQGGLASAIQLNQPLQTMGVGGNFSILNTTPQQQLGGILNTPQQLNTMIATPIGNQRTGGFSGTMPMQIKPANLQSSGGGQRGGMGLQSSGGHPYRTTPQQPSQYARSQRTPSEKATPQQPIQQQPVHQRTPYQQTPVQQSTSYQSAKPASVPQPQAYPQAQAQQQQQHHHHQTSQYPQQAGSAQHAQYAYQSKSQTAQQQYGQQGQQAQVQQASAHAYQQPVAGQYGQVQQKPQPSQVQQYQQAGNIQAAQGGPQGSQAHLSRSQQQQQQQQQVGSQHQYQQHQTQQSYAQQAQQVYAQPSQQSTQQAAQQPYAQQQLQQPQQQYGVQAEQSSQYGQQQQTGAQQTAEQQQQYAAYYQQYYQRYGQYAQQQQAATSVAPAATAYTQQTGQQAQVAAQYGQYETGQKRSYSSMQDQQGQAAQQPQTSAPGQSPADAAQAQYQQYYQYYGMPQYGATQQAGYQQQGQK